jgi:hypothetical protein
LHDQSEQTTKIDKPPYVRQRATRRHALVLLVDLTDERAVTHTKL